MRKIKCIAIDGSGNGKEVEFDSINEQSGLVWIDTGLRNISKVLNKFENKPLLAKEILAAKEPRPRAMIQDDALLATFRGVNLNAGQDPEDMVSVRVWISSKVIVTSHKRNLVAIKDLEQSLQNGTGPKDSAEFLENLLSLIIEKASTVVDAVGDSLDRIEDLLEQDKDMGNRRPVSEMRRRIIQLRRYLAPQREALTRIQPSKLSWLDDVHLMHMREVTDACSRLLEDLDSERERATVLYEEFFALAQEVMNQKMYLLTIVAIIFMPLGFITGLLGINVGGIPGSEYKFGFAIVCVLLLLIFIVQMIFLRRRRWL